MRHLGAKIALLLFGLTSCAQSSSSTERGEQASAGASADFVVTDQDSPDVGPPGRLYIGPLGLRIEYGPDANSVILVYDFARNVQILLNPSQTTYFETSLPNGILDSLDWFVRDGVCGESEDEHVRATKLGFETLRGRKAEKWRCEYDDVEESTWTIWVDPALPLPVRIVDNVGTVMELRNIQVGPQPETLFQVPAGYTKTDMPAMPAPGAEGG